jgi:hypothetical protein
VGCFSSQAFSQVLAACLPILDGKIGGDGDMMRIRPIRSWRVSQAAQCFSRKKVMGQVDEIRFTQDPSNQPEMQVKKTVICVDISQAISYLESSLA